MENTKSGRRRERQLIPTRAKAQDTTASSNTLGNSPSEEEMEHWTPTGAAPLVIWMDTHASGSSLCHENQPKCCHLHSEVCLNLRHMYLNAYQAETAICIRPGSVALHTLVCGLLISREP